MSLGLAGPSMVVIMVSDRSYQLRPERRLSHERAGKTQNAAVT